MTEPSIEELLNSKPNSTPSPEPQGSPQTGETSQPAEAAPEAIAPAHEAAKDGQPGENTNGATPAPQQPPEDDRIKAFQKAAEDERRKRQTYEREVQELRAHMAELQRLQQGKAQTPAQPEYLDPEGMQHLQAQLSQALQQERQQFQAALVETKVVQSQEIMRARYDDYDDAEAAFAQAAEQDPTLWQKLYAHPVPAQFAYQEGKRQRVLQQMGSDPEAYISKRVEEALAKRQAEQPPQPAPQPQTPAQPGFALPQSLAGVPSVTAQRAQSYQGPTPLDDLINAPLSRPRHR